MKLSHLHANFLSSSEWPVSKIRRVCILYRMCFIFKPRLAESSLRHWQSDSNKISLPCYHERIPTFFFARVGLYKHSAPSCSVKVLVFTMIYSLFSKVVSYFQVFEPKFCTYFFSHSTYMTVSCPSWSVAQDYTFRTPQPPTPTRLLYQMPVHVRKMANNQSSKDLKPPTFTSARVLIRTNRHYEIIYWSLVLCSLHGVESFRVSQLVKNLPNFMKPEDF